MHKVFPFKQNIKKNRLILALYIDPYYLKPVILRYLHMRDNPDIQNSVNTLPKINPMMIHNPEKNFSFSTIFSSCHILCSACLLYSVFLWSCLLFLHVQISKNSLKFVCCINDLSRKDHIFDLIDCIFFYIDKFILIQMLFRQL